MIIPMYEEAEDRAMAGKATPVDFFVLDNEPAGKDDEREWRRQLQALVNYVEEHAPLPPSIQEALNSGDGTYRP